MYNTRESLRHYRRIGVALAALCSVACIALGLLMVFSERLALRLGAMSMLVVMAATAWRILLHARRLHVVVTRQAGAAAEAEEHYFGILCEVMSVVEARDRFLAGRSRRMSQLVSQVAAEMGLDEQRVRLLGMVSRVHDIGLLSVPAEVISKAGGLSNLEFSVVRKHCRVGCHILQPLRILGPVLDAVVYHHERMNGTGYPEGLRGESIPLNARILAVADSYDAMTHDRPHRPAMLNERAMGELIRCADAGYDRQVVIALARTLHMGHLLPDDWTGGSVHAAAEADAENAPAEQTAAEDCEPATF